MSTLEQLNQQFREKQDERKKEKAAKKKQFLFRVTSSAVVLLLMIIVVVYVNRLKNKESNNVEDVIKIEESENFKETLAEEILTKKEKKDWKERSVDSEQVFIDVNTDLKMDNKNQDVFLRLINPPYSAYFLKTEIYQADSPETILYESDFLEPGDIVDYVKLEKEFQPGNYDLIICYRFYEEENDENSLGKYEVDASLYVSGTEDDTDTSHMVGGEDKTGNSK